MAEEIPPLETSADQADASSAMPETAKSEDPRIKGIKDSLPLRLLTASILLPIAITVTVLGGLWLLATVIILLLLGLREFYRLIEDKGAHPLVVYGMVAGASLPIVAYIGNEYHAMLLMTVMILSVMVAQLSKAEMSEALASISGTIFGVFYIGWLFSHVIVLRQFPEVVAHRWGGGSALLLHPEAGIFYVIFAVAIVEACDTGAYFVGRAFGKHKLAPKVSPGKTIEGALGGLAFGVLAGFAVKLLFDVFWPDYSRLFGWEAVAPIALLVAIAGTIGDLVESLLKRDAQRKDAGSLLPGTGGILDRIDSSLLGIPVMYYLLLGYTYMQLQGWS